MLYESSRGNQVDCLLRAFHANFLIHFARIFKYDFLDAHELTTTSTRMSDVKSMAMSMQRQISNVISMLGWNELIELRSELDGALACTERVRRNRLALRRS